MISVSYTFVANRRRYHIRLRGDGVDTKERIPDELFLAADPPINPRRKSSRGDQVAALYAAQERKRRNEVPTELRRDQEMSLEEVWNHYERKNPEQVQTATLKTYAKWVRALLRCRCARHDDLHCVAHRAPSTITLAVAEELRNARLLECRVCSIVEAEHPEPGTWKDRKTKTHAFMAISPRTHHNEQGFLLVLIDYAVERTRETGVRSKSLTRTPTIMGKKGIHAKAKYSPEQFLRIYRAAGELEKDGPRYQALYGFAVATGLRERPLTHFSRAWYDRETKMIHVPARWMKGRGDNYRALDVPISRWAASFLEPCIDDSRELVFPNPATGKAQPNFSLVEQKVTAAANLDRKVTFHAFRGTFNSWLTNHRCDRHTAEVPFFTREKLLGHQLPAQVEAYTDFSDAVLREALDVVDCIFDSLMRDASGVLPFRRRA